MPEIAIFGMGDNLIVPLQIELHDKAARDLQDDILKKIEKSSASGMIIDISALSIVDSFLGRLLGDTAKMARLMGVETVLVGMRKEIVITLLQLGFTISDMHTALNVEDGINLLEDLKSEMYGPNDEDIL